MRSEHLANSSRIYDSKDKNEASTAAEPTVGAAAFSPGAITWVKLGSLSWWPAQVANEGSVGKRNKPRKRLSTEVLVRLYGSYEYFYVDPIKSRSEFDDVVKKHNGSYREMMTIALELERTSLRKHETQGKKRKSEAENGSKKHKSEAENGSKKHSNTKKKLEPNYSSKASTNLGQEPRVLSERRLKVMQGLGLIAPEGSPFLRNGFNHKWAYNSDAPRKLDYF